jgi:hypothetical protein
MLMLVCHASLENIASGKVKYIILNCFEWNNFEKNEWVKKINIKNKNIRNKTLESLIFIIFLYRLFRLKYNRNKNIWQVL